MEDELSIPASPLADVSHAVVSLSVQADVDSELEWVFVDVGSLPKMVTPVGNPDGALTRALHTTPAAASRHSGESDAVGGGGGRIYLQNNQGCQFRMTSYDEGTDGPNFAPEYGVQLHDPRLLEYVLGAPESARLTSPSPEYWIHHMGREKALSAALQLQHDAGLILSNVQVLQQLVTALNRTSSDVLRAVHGRKPFLVEVFQQVIPSYRVCRAAHYMMAMGLWRPPVDAEIQALLPRTSCNACTSCRDC